MENAKRQAVDLARQSIEDFKNTAVLGFSAFASEFTSRLVLYIVFGAIVMLLFKICN